MVEGIDDESHTGDEEESLQKIGGVCSAWRLRQRGEFLYYLSNADVQH